MRRKWVGIWDFSLVLQTWSMLCNSAQINSLLYGIDVNKRHKSRHRRIINQQQQCITTTTQTQLCWACDQRMHPIHYIRWISNNNKMLDNRINKHSMPFRSTQWKIPMWRKYRWTEKQSEREGESESEREIKSILHSIVLLAMCVYNLLLERGFFLFLSIFCLHLFSVLYLSLSIFFNRQSCHPCLFLPLKFFLHASSPLAPSLSHIFVVDYSTLLSTTTKIGELRLCRRYWQRHILTRIC